MLSCALMETCRIELACGDGSFAARVELSSDLTSILWVVSMSWTSNRCRIKSIKNVKRLIKGGPL